MKKTAVVLIIILLAALLPGSAQAEDIPPTPPPPLTETGLPEVLQLLESGPPEGGLGPEEFPWYINPLTGLVVGDLTILDRRPVAIKVTNYPRYVRPQSGLSRADIVFEYYMERRIPRFIAVFYGNEVEKVGPIRSGRLFDEHIFRMYQSYFAFGYADIHVLKYFKELEPEFGKRFVLEIGADKAVKCAETNQERLCRQNGGDGYNTMFANTRAVQESLERRYDNNERQDLAGMYFTDYAPPSLYPGTTLKLRFSPSIYHYWEFDPDTNLYLRWQETEGNLDLSVEKYEPHYDALTEEQLSASNVVFLVVDHEFLAYTENTEILGMDLHGSGVAYVFRDGFYYPAFWVRPENAGVLQITTPEGEPFPLKPGQTWFEVISQYSELNRNGTTWRFQFELPPIPDEKIYVMDPDLDPLDWFFEFQNPGASFPPGSE